MGFARTVNTSSSSRSESISIFCVSNAICNFSVSNPSRFFISMTVPPTKSIDGLKPHVPREKIPGTRTSKEIDRYAHLYFRKLIMTHILSRHKHTDKIPADNNARKQRSEEHTSELQSQFHLVCRL